MRKKRGGFTLLEIMLVVTIIALLMGAAIYKLAGNVEVGRRVRVQGDIQASMDFIPRLSKEYRRWSRPLALNRGHRAGLN